VIAQVMTDKETENLRETFRKVKQEMLEKNTIKRKEEEKKTLTQMHSATRFGEVVGRKNAETLKMIMEASTAREVNERPAVSVLPSLEFAVTDGTEGSRFKGMNVGPLLMKWLPLVEDFTFGLSPDKNIGGYVMGNCRVEFDSEDNFYFTKRTGEVKKFKGTNGLWELVTKIKPTDYTQSDLKAYTYLCNGCQI